MTLCRITARMAELVDALVSKTSGISRAGSTPAPGTKYTISVFSFLPNSYLLALNFLRADSLKF
jgi:hypothetical protein